LRPRSCSFEDLRSLIPLGFCRSSLWTVFVLTGARQRFLESLHLLVGQEFFGPLNAPVAWLIPCREAIARHADRARPACAAHSLYDNSWPPCWIDRSMRLASRRAGVEGTVGTTEAKKARLT
jgi:hypothetical protein